MVHILTQTADNKILNNYTGYYRYWYGGEYDGVLGMNKKVWKRLKGFSSRYVPCEDNIRLNGIECEITNDGRCKKIDRINIGIDEIWF